MNKKKFLNNIRYRISIFRSNREIYAQIINDLSNTTIVSYSSINRNFVKNFDKKNMTKLKLSNLVGKQLGIKLKNMGIKKLVFRQKRYKYHGRIKSLIDGIRNTGIQL